jgi:small-conductance mechanosensitive channel
MKKASLLFLILLCSFYSSHYSLAQNAQSSADTLVQEKLSPISLIDINYEIERLEKDFKKIESSLEPDRRVIAIDSMFRAYKLFLEKEAREFNSYNPYNLSKFFLENAYRLWEGFYLILSGWQNEVNNRLKSVQDNIEQLEQVEQVWKVTLEKAEADEGSIELNKRINRIIGTSKEYRTELVKLKWKYITLEDDISDMASFCDDVITKIQQLQRNQQDSLFVAVSPPIWEVKVSKSDYSPLSSRLNKARHENAKILKNYFLTQALNTFWVVVGLIIILFIILRYRYQRKKFDDSHPGHKNVFRIFAKHPFLTIASLILVAFHLMYPYYPLVLNHILTLVLLINMRFILSDFIDREDKAFILKVIILLLVNDLQVIFWYLGDLARYYLLFESILGIYLALPYLKPATWRKLYRGPNVKKTKLLLAATIVVFYFISLLSNLFGYIDLAVLVSKVGIHVPEFTIVLFGIYKITVALIRALISVWSMNKNSMFEGYWEDIEKRSVKIAGLLAVIYWFYSLTVSFEVSRVIFESLGEFLTAERAVGTMHITIGSIFALILILLVTFIITGVLKVVMEHILLKRARLPRGVPAAISVTIRYFLIILGFMFALSAAGIELGKFSLLAGALGVGIGFGLQNIVNNFISGLILVYERPLQVGDTIEVENLLGQVKRIGIRSSNVRTYDGAEVVVPNGNLISNQLINWTLSDKTRRIEIKVGVSYGSDPNVVLELLEKVANENEDVLKDPPPWALFEDFGNSSLNFRLLFWVPYELGIRTKSAIAVAVFNIFRENGVEIPFPQLDLHMKKEPDPISEEEIRSMEAGKKKPDPGKSTSEETSEPA